MKFQTFGTLSLYIPEITNDIEIKEEVEETYVVEEPARLNKMCEECGELVPPERLSRHMKLKHTYTCDECPKSFSNEHALKEHVKCHNKENKYPCLHCSLSFATITAYTRHNLTHEKTIHDTFNCHLCDFKTTLKSSLLNHVKLHADEEYKFTCHICGKKYLTRLPFEDHLATHEGILTYACEYCPKKFVLAKYLTSHRKMNHHQEIFGVELKHEHACHVCGRTFKYSNSLLRHLRCIHKVGKDLTKKCELCGKVYTNSYHLKMHMRVHTGEKPFVCETCGKAFTKKHKMNVHIRRIHLKKEQAATDSEKIKVEYSENPNS